MSTVFLNISTRIRAINLFGFIVPIDIDWYGKDTFIAIDLSGDVYCYKEQPKKYTTYWSTRELAHAQCIGRILEFATYESTIPGITEWVADNWDKQLWCITEFPLVESIQ